MSLYLSYSVNLKGKKPSKTIWSNTETPVLGILSNNQVSFFQDEGVYIEEYKLSNCKISDFCWHPNKLITAYGCEDGKVGYWIHNSIENKNNEEKIFSHETPINIITFNNVGNRIVSSDLKNNIVVWNFDGGLFKLCIYQQKFQIESIIFGNFNINKYPE